MLDVKYSLELVESDNGLKNVDFYDFSYIYNNYAVVVKCNDEALVGNYTMNLVGTYSFAFGTQSVSLRVPFVIELEAPPRTFTVEPEHFYFEIPDHSMDFQETWSYEINGNKTVTGRYGDEMTIELNLGKAADILHYDKDTKTITIKEGDLTRADVEKLEIEAYAHFSNETYTEHYKTTFSLTIRDDNPIIPEP